jgi:hypothetical protein
VGANRNVYVFDLILLEAVPPRSVSLRLLGNITMAQQKATSLLIEYLQIDAALFIGFLVNKNMANII